MNKSARKLLEPQISAIVLHNILLPKKDRIFLDLNLLISSSSPVKSKYSSAGFTLTELLIVCVIIVLASVVALGAISTSSRFSRDARDRSMADSFIEADIAKLNLAASRYTYCTGQYTWNGSLCNTAAPGSQNYYFPLATPTSSTNALKFENDCKSGVMINSLIAAFNGGDLAFALSSAASQKGIVRSNSVAEDPMAHRMLITYAYAGDPKYRTIAIVPLAAGWCP